MATPANSSEYQLVLGLLEARGLLEGDYQQGQELILEPVMDDQETYGTHYQVKMHFLINGALDRFTVRKIRDY